VARKCFHCRPSESVETDLELGDNVSTSNATGEIGGRFGVVLFASMLSKMTNAMRLMPSWPKFISCLGLRVTTNI